MSSEFSEAAHEVTSPAPEVATEFPPDLGSIESSDAGLNGLPGGGEFSPPPVEELATETLAYPDGLEDMAESAGPPVVDELSLSAADAGEVAGVSGGVDEVFDNSPPPEIGWDTGTSDVAVVPVDVPAVDVVHEIASGSGGNSDAKQIESIMVDEAATSDSDRAADALKNSGLTFSADMKNVVESGAVDHLMKSVDAKEILGTVRTDSAEHLEADLAEARRQLDAAEAWADRENAASIALVENGASASPGQSPVDAVCADEAPAENSQNAAVAIEDDLGVVPGDTPQVFVDNADESPIEGSHRIESIQEDAVMLADHLTDGHAFSKHREEFGDDLSKGEFSEIASNIISSPDEVRLLSGDRAGFWSDKHGAVVFLDENSKDGGTMFRPVAGKEYFDEQQ